MSLIAVWAVLVMVSALWHWARWEPVARPIECVHCRNKRLVMRWATIALVGLMILWHGLHGAYHGPDVGFFALVLVSELT